METIIGRLECLQKSEDCKFPISGYLLLSGTEDQWMFSLLLGKGDTMYMTSLADCIIIEVDMCSRSRINIIGGSLHSDKQYGVVVCRRV